MVLVNPPYFKVAPGHVVNPNEKKAIARHEILVDLEHIILQASQVLKNKGRLVMVHRPERLGEICYFCQNIIYRSKKSNHTLLVQKKKVTSLLLPQVKMEQVMD